MKLLKLLAVFTLTMLSLADERLIFGASPGLNEGQINGYCVLYTGEGIKEKINVEIPPQKDDKYAYYLCAGDNEHVEDFDKCGTHEVNGMTAKFAYLNKVEEGNVHSFLEPIVKNKDDPVAIWCITGEVHEQFKDKNINPATIDKEIEENSQLSENLLKLIKQKQKQIKNANSSLNKAVLRVQNNQLDKQGEKLLIETSTLEKLIKDAKREKQEITKKSDMVIGQIQNNIKTLNIIYANSDLKLLYLEKVALHEIFKTIFTKVSDVNGININSSPINQNVNFINSNHDDNINNPNIIVNHNIGPTNLTPEENISNSSSNTQDHNKVVDPIPSKSEEKSITENTNKENTNKTKKTKRTKKANANSTKVTKHNTNGKVAKGNKDTNRDENVKGTEKTKDKKQAKSTKTKSSENAIKEKKKKTKINILK
jgi:hypothetical protein